MKISVILLTANPTEKQYAWKEALASYIDLADEIILVDGGTEDLTTAFPLEKKLQIIDMPDPEIWNWAEHAKRLNFALDKATGDWIIKVDIDWIFHEKDFGLIRQKLSYFDTPVVTFQKKTIYPFRKYIQKGEVPIGINKKDKHHIRFGKDLDTYSDLTYPIWWQQRKLIDEYGVPIGKLITKKDWGKTGLDFWNFDYTFTTLENMKKKWLRMSKSHNEYFGSTSWGHDEEEAFIAFMNNMRGKLSRSIDLGDITLPKYIKERIDNLKPEEFGHSFWGLL